MSGVVENAVKRGAIFRLRREGIHMNVSNVNIEIKTHSHTIGQTESQSMRKKTHDHKRNWEANGLAELVDGYTMSGLFISSRATHARGPRN